jgi:uncharacterized protein
MFSTSRAGPYSATEKLFLTLSPSITYERFVASRLQPECFACASCARETDPRFFGQEGTLAKEDRGFASMDRTKQRDIASKGGKAAHQKGTAHEWTSEEAREAGRKGGMASHRRKQGGEPSSNPGENENNSGPSDQMIGHGDLG